MPDPSPASDLTDVARLAATAVELLEVLWDRGREATTMVVSASQLRVLYVLEADEGISLRGLATALNASPSSVSRLCDRLQTMGLLERTPSPVSRRQLQLRLTRHGRTVLENMRAEREKDFTDVLDGMPADAREALVRGLLAFREAASSHLRSQRGDMPDSSRQGMPASVRSA